MRHRLQQIADSLGLSLNRLAVDLGYAKGYLSHMVSGERQVNGRVVQLLCSKYNVNEKWFETGVGEMFNSPNPLEADSTQVVVNYIKSILSELSEPNRQIVLEAVRQLKEGKNFSDPSIQSGPD